ncbi:MAG: TonB-dependent receptor [Ignavibacteriales bacterium]|nr:TonB-dependent receptor [Ignavibacteriales bacterium]
MSVLCRVGVFVFVIGGFLFPSRCDAQQAGDSVKYQLPLVTTIGTRIAEPWLEVPLALTVLSKSSVALTKGYGLDEALTLVPGVFAISRYGNQDIRITIRGFGARGAGERSNSGTARGIRVLSDGFPETEPDGRTAFDLVDLAGAGSIEVIRSNASSLWGNAAGGVVNIRSNTSFDEPYAAYSSAFGDFGFHKEMVQAGARLGTGKLAVSFSNTNADGWRWHSNSSLSLLNIALLSQLGEQTSLGVYLAGASNLFRIPGPMTQLQYDDNAQQSDSLYIKRDERRFNRLGRLGAALSHNIGNEHSFSASVFVNPKYLQRSERNTFRDFTRYHAGGNVAYQNNTTLGGDIKNIMLVGADEAYQDGAILFYNLTASGGRGSTLSDNKREGANNFGVFLQDEIVLSERWSVLLGGRYDDITYYGQSFIKPWLNDSRSFTHFTPKGGVTFRLTPTHSFYANIGGGVEVPAGNETDPVPPDTIHAVNLLLDPITSSTIEVGTKQLIELGSGGWKGTLVYDIALYWLQVTNDIIPYRNGRFYFTAGETRRMGAEFGGKLHLLNGLSIEAALTISDNKYVEYKVDSVYYSASKANIFADYKDNKVAGVPNAHYSGAVKFSPSFVERAYMRVGIQGSGGYYADDPNQVWVPAWQILNASIGLDQYRLGGSAFYVSGFFSVQNLLDKKYVGSAWINPDLNAQGKPMYIESGLPRNMIASFTLGAML